MARLIYEGDIENALLQKLHSEFGYELLNCFTKNSNDLNDGSNRNDKSEVIFKDRLKTAALRLNENIPETAIDRALAVLSDRRRTMSAVAANYEIDKLIRDGVQVEFENEAGKKETQRVRFIHFNDSSKNDYLAVSQLWIRGEYRYRRPDVLLYVNGLPLVFIELKNSNVPLQSAFDDNLTNYKEDIPQLFHTNAFCILSNAIESKVGSFTAGWEFFFNWLRVESESEKVDRNRVAAQGLSLEYAMRGLCAPARLLDYVENFILFKNKSQKIIAQNHQFIGVNNAFERFKQRKTLEGKLGVFWHTQGSGKSFSMIFYTRKIMRKLTGNFTFVVVTDRDDLDSQIYRNFLTTETIGKDEAAQPKNSEELRKFLGQNKRVVFTLIQKFRYDKGKTYPLLSERNDIVVIVDEAHRTQYKSLAENMRNGLKNAQYLAFTGTPLLGRTRKTNAWFGEYVSEYNFQQSMEDGATVPLYYEKRVPEVLIQNDNLSEEFYQLLEDEELDELQQSKLERKFAKEIEVIKRDDRLETIAKDIVYHFPRRGYLGKAMVISLDKFTTVKMYDKVQHHWKAELKALRGRINESRYEMEKERLKKRLEQMKRVEMAVVISEEAKEEAKFTAQGLNIKPHRERMQKLDKESNDIEDNFKDSEHPLQLVFVTAMWLTGFDAPTVSTLYLDKPMKDHTLMQTIARANRVSSFVINGVSKRNGEIVDYYNVFRNMKKALKDYAQGEEGLDDVPVQDKSELFVLLDDAIAQAQAFCLSKNIDLTRVLDSDEVFKNIEAFNEFANILLEKDAWRKEFYVYQNTVDSLYEACKPEVLSQPPRRLVLVLDYLRGVIDVFIGAADIDAISRKITDLLDESVVVDNAEKFTQKEHGAEFQIVQKGRVWDLSKLNFEKLKEEFAQATYKHIEIADLRVFIEQKVKQMLDENLTRIDFAEKLQSIIDTYNSGGSSTENYFDELMKFAENLQAEEERHVKEELSPDELELFDLLSKKKMSEPEKQKVKLAAKELLRRLIDAHPKVLVQDWYKDSQSQKVVRSTVEAVLDENLPESYDRKLFNEKCTVVFETMLDFASHGKKWVA